MYHLLGRGRICDKWEASILLELNGLTLLYGVRGGVISRFRFEMCNSSLFIFEVKLFCYLLTSLVGLVGFFEHKLVSVCKLLILAVVKKSVL